MKKKAQKVKQAAIRSSNGRVITMPRPKRHHNISRYMYEEGIPIGDIRDQGFLLEDGTFVRRKAAAYQAIQSGQIKELNYPPYLYSEDLW